MNIIQFLLVTFVSSKWTNDILTNTAMKKRIITPLLFLLVLAGFSQDLSYSVQGKYVHPVTKETLNKAESMKDIIPYYPSNWIAGYSKVEISASQGGQEMMAAGTNETLVTKQKSILNSVDFGTDIVINITYTTKNPLTGNIYTGEMNYSATVIPETEAEYTGGYPEMAQYLKENAIDKISEEASAKFQQAKVEFTVDEEGEIANALISQTSGDQETDELLLNVINQMPKWKPAEDTKGRKVRQDFEFTVGNVGC
jgi:TonB family protein